MIVASEVRFEEGQEINEWQRLALREIRERGRPPLRGVYELNLLSAEQIQIPMSDRMNLGEWIISSTDHGVLDDFGDDCWLWRLQAHQIGVAQVELERAGLVRKSPRRYRGAHEASA